ncbi:MAG: hypothetical protein FWD89_01170 [Firmicutes bacterium]|nr:hypothetical protein [Bacillota bacterium]MCL2770902.1 hypothetical protein [Bacillota bacterium]
MDSKETFKQKKPPIHKRMWCACAALFLTGASLIALSQTVLVSGDAPYIPPDDTELRRTIDLPNLATAKLEALGINPRLVMQDYSLTRNSAKQGETILLKVDTRSVDIAHKDAIEDSVKDLNEIFEIAKTGFDIKAVYGDFCGSTPNNASSSRTQRDIVMTGSENHLHGNPNAIGSFSSMRYLWQLGLEGQYSFYGHIQLYNPWFKEETTTHNMKKAVITHEIIHKYLYHALPTEYSLMRSHLARSGPFAPTPLDLLTTWIMHHDISGMTIEEFQPIFNKFVEERHPHRAKTDKLTQEHVDIINEVRKNFTMPAFPRTWQEANALRQQQSQPAPMQTKVAAVSITTL